MLNLVVAGTGNNISRGFEIGREYYTITDLTHGAGPSYPIVYRVPINTSRLTSEVVKLGFPFGEFMLLMTEGNNIKIIGSTDPDLINEPIRDVQRQIIPDMALYQNVVVLPEQLEIMELPPFNRELYRMIRSFANEHYSPFFMFSLMLERGMIPSFPTYLEEELPEDIISQEFVNSYTALLKRLYNLSPTIPEFLIVNNKLANFIPFSQLSNIQIASYTIDPLLQPYANSPNNIITILDNNGISYLVKAKYDPINNRIFQPI